MSANDLFIIYFTCHTFAIKEDYYLAKQKNLIFLLKVLDVTFASGTRKYI